MLTRLYDSHRDQLAKRPWPDIESKGARIPESMSVTKNMLMTVEIIRPKASDT